MRLRFRDIPKDYVPGSIPTELVDRIREIAFKERRSHASVVTELVCKGLGISPARFGINGASKTPRPPKQPGKVAASA